MNDCATCGYPLTWSDDKMRPHCAVFGDHAELRQDDDCHCSTCDMQRARWQRARATRRLKAVS